MYYNFITTITILRVHINLSSTPIEECLHFIFINFSFQDYASTVVNFPVFLVFFLYTLLDAFGFWQLLSTILYPQIANHNN